MRMCTITLPELTGRERQLLSFLRELGWGVAKVRVENGQPVVIFEAVKTCKLVETNEVPRAQSARRRKSARLA